MKIKTATSEFEIVQAINRSEYIGLERRDVIEVQSEAPLLETDIESMENDPNWNLVHEDGVKVPYPYYNEPVRYSIWMGKVSPSDEVIIAKDAEIAAITAQKQVLITEKEVLVTEKTALAEENTVLETKNEFLGSAIPILVEGKPAEIALQYWEYFPDWAEGNWRLNQNLKYNDYPYFVYQAHDSTGNPGWNPEATPAMFSPWHAKTAETALAWRTPTGAHDIYKTGEYMVFTDGVTYKAKQDTNYSPSEYAQAWEAV